MSANHRVETLMEAMGRGFNVAVHCRRCGRRRVLSSPALMRVWMRRGWPMRIARLHEHLRCEACRPNDVEVTLTGAKADGFRQPHLDPEDGG